MTKLMKEFKIKHEGKLALLMLNKSVNKKEIQELVDKREYTDYEWNKFRLWEYVTYITPIEICLKELK